MFKKKHTWFFCFYHAGKDGQMYYSNGVLTCHLKGEALFDSIKEFISKTHNEFVILSISRID